MKHLRVGDLYFPDPSENFHRITKLVKISLKLSCSNFLLFKRGPKGQNGKIKRMGRKHKAQIPLTVSAKNKPEGKNTNLQGWRELR